MATPVDKVRTLFFGLAGSGALLALGGFVARSGDTIHVIFGGMLVSGAVAVLVGVLASVWVK